MVHPGLDLADEMHTLNAMPEMQQCGGIPIAGGECEIVGEGDAMPGIPGRPIMKI